MEQLTFEWGKLLATLQKQFGTKPSLDGILFLIGVRELGKHPETKFTKEQKQDLMHIATCRVLSEQDYFELIGTDADGWPHWQAVKPLPAINLQEQENLIKRCVLAYFSQMDVYQN